ncbi:MAG: hypothetical protein RDV41_11600 [Planctomycetota bacterium]|nr:hypothetical protein [Planctomycetota bacterium]
MIKARLTDIPVLSGYLHDAEMNLRDVNYVESDRSLHVRLLRIHHEEPKRGRFLFLFPVVRYRYMPSLLTVTQVAGIEFKRPGRRRGPPDVGLLLVCVCRRDNDDVCLETDSLDIVVHASADADLILQDDPKPQDRYCVVDLGRRPLFSGMDEIDKLRVND